MHRLRQSDAPWFSVAKALSRHPDTINVGRIFALSAQTNKARTIVKELESENYFAEGTLIALGEYDKAFETINTMLDDQARVPFFNVAPWYDPIRDDPRFKDILAKAGLAE